MRTQFNYFLKIFSEGHNHESSGNNIEHRYTHHTTTQAECIPPYYLQKYTSMFEHGLLPCLPTDYLFMHPPPPPPHNDRIYDHNAMLAFPQEKISHYTTGWLGPRI